MPLKASIAANAVQEQLSAKLGAQYSPRERFRSTWQPGKIIRHLVRRGADECFEALTKRAFAGECSVVAPEGELASQLNVSERTVRTYIRILEAQGLISTRREWRYHQNKHQLVNRYTFHDHAVLREYLGDDRPRKEVNRTGSTGEPRPAPIPIRPPASPAPPQQPVAEPSIPAGMSMMCWFSKDVGTMVYLFFPLEQTTQAPKERKAASTKGSRNPVPETNPYYQAVRRISYTPYFRSTDPASYEDVAAEFERLQVPPEIANQIAHAIVRSEKGYEFHMIESMYRSYRSSQPAPRPVRPVEETIECQKCLDTGVAGDSNDTKVFCGCTAGQERIAIGWVKPDYDDNKSYWQGIFRRSNVSIERKPPERETGHLALENVGGGSAP